MTEARDDAAEEIRLNEVLRALPLLDELFSECRR
jgi:hypothetical protein